MASPINASSALNWLTIHYQSLSEEEKTGYDWMEASEKNHSVEVEKVTPRKILYSISSGNGYVWNTPFNLATKNIGVLALAPYLIPLAFCTKACAIARNTWKNSAERNASFINSVKNEMLADKDLIGRDCVLLAVSLAAFLEPTFFHIGTGSFMRPFNFGTLRTLAALYALYNPYNFCKGVNDFEKLLQPAWLKEMDDDKYQKLDFFERLEKFAEGSGSLSRIFNIHCLGRYQLDSLHRGTAEPRSEARATEFVPEGKKEI